VAAKIVRQPNRIALLGAPTSAAALLPGHELAPGALRAAGLISKLQSIGYNVTELGDDPVQVSSPDEESPRARNLSKVICSLEALKPRVEHAVKLGALPLILGGDCSIALAVVAGVRRHFRNVGLLYMDRDADLNTPATTASGCLDGMVVSHLTGRGAPELVRFWSEPPLVREPDLALFGVDRLDPPEEDVLSRSPLRRYLAMDVIRMGAAAAAQLAIERIHGESSEFVLHFDVDVIAGFQATNYPGSAGLSLEDVRAALEVFVRQKHLAAIEVTAYNPQKDSDGSGAKLIIDLLAGILQARLAALQGASSEGNGAESPTVSVENKLPDPAPASKELVDVSIAPGEAWTSESPDAAPLPSDPLPSDLAASGLEPSASPTHLPADVPDVLDPVDESKS
jgi:arginase